MAENSVHGLLWELVTALEDLLDGWDNNQDGVDLNELDANEFYPFDKSLDEVLNDVRTWADEVEEEIGSNFIDARGKIDTSHIHLFDSLKESKKLTETWAGEDVISDLVDRAESWVDDGYDIDEAVTRALDDGLIYTKDIRTLAEHYDVLPDDSELIGLFYEELYGDVYNELSERVGDREDDEVEEDEEDFGESFKSYTVPKKLVEKRGQKFEFDEKELEKELKEVKKIFDEQGAEGLADMAFGIAKKKFPNFIKWFERYHEGMESNEKGDLDENSTPVDEYWAFMDETDFKALFEFIKDRAGQTAIKYYMQFADLYDSGLDETEVLADKIANGEIKMVNGGH